MISKNPLSEMDSKTIAWISQEAEEQFQAKFADALAIFDNAAVVKVVEAELKLNGFPQSVLEDFMPETLVKCLAETFTRLLQRGALDAYQRFSVTPEVQRQIDEMGGATPDPVDPEVEASETQAALMEECVKDYRGRMSSAAFKRKYMGADPVLRSVYDQVAASGKI